MRKGVLAAALLVSACGVASELHAQQQGRVTVTGFAFDSLHNVPLAGAFITIGERSRATTSDAKGKFTFDTLPPGTYTFSAQHAVFDSLGLSGTSTRAVVTDGKAIVTVAVPSFATVWRALCGAIPVPAKGDSGVVYGSIREAQKQALVAQASIEVSWIDLVNLGTKEARNISQRRWKNEAQGDLQGGYAVCGVPLNTPLYVRASYLRNATGLIDLPASEEKVRRRDLMVPGISPGDSALRGTMTGVVNDPEGKGIPGVRVIVDDTTETRSDAQGRFVMNVRAGTRQVDFASIGMTPISQVVDVIARDTVFANATLRTVTTLEAVSITASRSRLGSAIRFDERRKQGLGQFADSSTIGQRATLSAVFSGFAGVTSQAASANGRRFNIYLPSTGTAKCLAVLKIDGVQQYDHEILSTMHPSEIAAIEVYSRRTNVPSELASTVGPCGVVAVWTKSMFR